MKNLTFCAFLAILLLLLFAIYGCGGTRNTDTSNSETKTNNINIENTYSMGSKIVMANNYTFRPLDNLKPFYVDGQKYENVAITVNKDITTEKTITINTKYNRDRTITIEKNKTTTRTDNTMLWLGMFLIVVVAVFAWLYLPKLKTGI